MPIKTLPLDNGSQAVIYADGTAEITDKAGEVTYDRVEVGQAYDDVTASNGLPTDDQLKKNLTKTRVLPFVPGRLIVVYRDGVVATQSMFALAPSTLQSIRKHPESVVPSYTNDMTLNRILTRLGVASEKHLFGSMGRTGTYGSFRRQTLVAGPALNISNAYRLEVTSVPVRQAVALLRKSPAVLYASPDWIVSGMHATPLRLPAKITSAAINHSRSLTGHTLRPLFLSQQLPNNYAISSSAQSLLNTPGVNAAGAFDEIATKFGQLPGQGEIITNVSLGDLLNPINAGLSSTGPCAQLGQYYQTTHQIGGQQYIDWPAMPLIAAYSTDVNGNVSGTAAVCNSDLYLEEVGLDFSVMAPLPHSDQRAGETGSGYGDLLGIAPGATYRLMVPQTQSDAGVSDIDAALLAAATQNPRPNVITASLGFGFDALGFSGRFLEDDPLTQAIIASIVSNYNIVVCVSAGDGTRTYTTAAIGPSGGSTPTQVVATGGTPSNLNDVSLTTVPSADFDSGSIDVGGSTLDDIFAAPPQNSQFAALASQHAFAETRWTGFTDFSSGFGTRVNVSAPSDNGLALFALPTGGFDNVGVELTGGTSESAPEVAAAAAVVLQVGRLTGHPFQNPVDVRSFLQSTATPVAAVPQADVNINVGPQINLTNAVETLFHNAGQEIKPAVVRVGIEQRRNYGLLDGAFLTDTDPGYIDLQGPSSIIDGSNTDRNEKAWITVAPDWEGIPPGAHFALSVTGKSTVPLATTPWARLLPEQILAAAALPLSSPLQRTVPLTYRASVGLHILAQTSFTLIFGPADPTTHAVLAPTVPPLVTGDSIPVSYDLTNVRDVSNPTLIVSSTGRVDPPAALGHFNPAYTLPLTTVKGTVSVPVSALEGGGIYGIGIAFGAIQGNTLYSDFAFTRLGAGVARPAAPLLTDGTVSPSHSLEFDYGKPLHVSWDVSNVPGATGALLEVSAPGPTTTHIFNTFNNPNGSVRDNNGFDFGSVAAIPVSGAAGSVTLDPIVTGIVPTFIQTMRVLATAGGQILGEAGDISALEMDGVVVADGGSPSGGFGIDPNGTAGFLTSNQFNGTELLESLEAFDQTTHKVTGTLASASQLNGSQTYHFYKSTGHVYANGVAEFTDESSCPFRTCAFPYFTDSLNSLSLSTGALAPWIPVVPAPFTLEYASRGDINDSGAFVGSTVPAPGRFTKYAFASNLLTSVTSPDYNVTPSRIDRTCSSRANYSDTALNTTTNVMLLPATNCANLELLNFNTGTTSTISGLHVRAPASSTRLTAIAVDSTTNIAAVDNQTDGALEIFNLTAGTVKEVPIPGWDRLAVSVAVDQINHLFVVLQPFAGANAGNNNELGAILVYDEAGNLLSQQNNINMGGPNFRLFTKEPQIKASTRTGYVIGSMNDQLQPIKY